MSEDEQQSLAFARAVLHMPPWMLIDEVLDSLDEDTLARVRDVLATDLIHAGVIHIGRADVHDHVFSRVLHLIKDPTAHKLARGKAPDASPASTTTATATATEKQTTIEPS